jgi:hypothetical protein
LFIQLYMEKKIRVVTLSSQFCTCVLLQAALPLAVTSFVYAEEYKVHADIMSTGFVPFTTH